MQEIGVKYNSVTLYKRAKTGKVQVWECWMEMEAIKGKGGFVITPCILRKSGQLEGKQNTKKKYVKKGKNIGKANETTPWEQAEFEQKNMILDKIEDNMVDDIEKIDDDPKYLYPALAIPHNLPKTKKLLKSRGYLYVQPKLNGARCWNIRHLQDCNHGHTETPECQMTSRKLKIFDAIEWMGSEIDRLFKSGNAPLTPDGEIFNPDWDFQTIISFVKKYYERDKNPDYPGLATKDLQYHVYDIAMNDYPYEARKEILDTCIPEDHPFIKRVATHKVESIEEIDKWNEHYISLGYEGLIIRDPESLYAFNDRNDSLIKYKKFYDKEFKIVDFTSEIWDDVLSGVQRKLVIWICETETGKRFRSRPKGSFLERERLYKIASMYIGSDLTVRYQELSQDGTPIMNVGHKLGDIIPAEGVRDYE